MAAQLDHLTELTRRPNLRLGVSPWDRPLTMHARHAFHPYDTHTVIVGTESGTALITDPKLLAALNPLRGPERSLPRAPGIQPVAALFLITA